MNSIIALLHSRAALRLRLPAVTLFALLQRSPVARLLTAAADAFSGAGPGNGFVLRATVVTAAALGAVDSLAGATAYVLSATKSTPVSETLGQNESGIGFTVTNTISIGSWKIIGPIPPGMQFTAVEGGNTVSGAGGILDATTGGMDDGYGGTTGGNSQTTPILSGTPTVAGTYSISLTAYEFGAVGGLVSPTYTFTINVAGGTQPPAFTTNPASQTVSAGATVTFTAAASNGATYQWFHGTQTLAGQTGATLTLNNVQTSDGGNYYVVATNAGGQATSATASLTVNAVATKPSFVTQPLSHTIATGGTVVLTAAVTGATSYQWSLNGNPISGATSANLVVNNMASSNAGTYTLAATNAVGTSVSSSATLAVSSTNNFGRLINLSVLTPAGASQPLTLGFFTGGGGTSGQQPLLIRASGPALAAFGVSPVLADPTLTLIAASNNSTVATNDNWGTPASNVNIINTADSATGAFALSNSASLDAAMVQTLGAGGYSVVVSGNGSSVGNTIAEAYDYTANFTPTSPRLINLSCLDTLTAGGNLTAGFTIGGSTSRTVLVRATGPALAGFGVGGTMPDPKIVLVATGNGTTLATNAAWGGDAQITSIGNRVGAFAISDPNSKDSVVMMTLAPGTYTATANSVSGTGGTVLVEIYEVP